MAIDLGRAIKTAMTTGEVRFGLAQTRKALKAGKARLVIVAANCPDRSLRETPGAKVLPYEGTNAELGALCGKPFSVAALVVIKAGESGILSAV